MVTAEILHFLLSLGYMLSQVLVEIVPFLTPTTIGSQFTMTVTLEFSE